MYISSSPSFMVNQVLGCGALSEMVSTGKVQTPEEDGESKLQFPCEEIISDLKFVGILLRGRFWMRMENFHGEVDFFIPKHPHV